MTGPRASARPKPAWEVGPERAFRGVMMSSSGMAMDGNIAPNAARQGMYS
jgi:hypothetical protein